MKYYRTILNAQAIEPAFVPTDIAGCQLWLDAADDSTISIGTGVSQWDDKSGNGNDATQSIAASQPAYLIADKNGKNVVDFDGSNDHLLVNGVASVFNGNNKSYSLFVVVKPDTTASTQETLGGSNSTTNTPYFLHWFRNDSKIVQVKRNDSSVQIVATSTNSYNTNYAVLEFLHSGTNISCYYNNNLEFNVSQNLGTSTINLATIGADRFSGGSGSLFLNGKIAEIILYDSDQSVNRTTIQNYLSTKWDI